MVRAKTTVVGGFAAKLAFADGVANSHGLKKARLGCASITLRRF
jgi:hypothetical protein